MGGLPEGLTCYERVCFVACCQLYKLAIGTLLEFFWPNRQVSVLGAPKSATFSVGPVASRSSTRLAHEPNMTGTCSLSAYFVAEKLVLPKFCDPEDEPP